jgi:hypothetical protein
MTIYVSTIKPTVIYAVETWNLTERDLHYLMIFERRTLKKSFRPVQERDGWRIRTNHELDILIGAKILRFIKIQRIKCLGHLHRMEEYRMVRRIVEWGPMEKKSRESPGNRRRDEVLKDFGVFSVKN